MSLKSFYTGFAASYMTKQYLFYVGDRMSFLTRKFYDSPLNTLGSPRIIYEAERK